MALSSLRFSCSISLKRSSILVLRVDASCSLRMDAPIDGGAMVFANLLINAGSDSFETSFTIDESIPLGETVTVDMEVITSPFAFDYGIPFDVTAEFEVGVVQAGAVEFHNSVILSDIRVEDEFGSVQFQLTAESGTEYPVPEPAGIVFLAVGFIFDLVRPRTRQGRLPRAEASSDRTD